MKHNPFAPPFSGLPDSLPIFPLAGALLLPGGTLPLHIFEPRYLAMINDAMAGERFIGMVQSKQGRENVLYSTGCAGKITEFSELADGCYDISLTGICRYDMLEDMDVETEYRRVRPDWGRYTDDLKLSGCLGLDRDRLLGMLKPYFEKEGLSCEWARMDDVSDGKLITCLSMICPFDVKDKQALLEAECCKSRAALFMDFLGFSLKCSEEWGCDTTEH